MALAACSSPEDIGEAVGVEQAEAANRGGESALEQVERRIAGGAKETTFEDEAEADGGSRTFRYTWPAQVTAIPELAAILERQRAEALAEQARAWQQSLEEFAGDDCVTCKTRGFYKQWTVAADSERFLSLRGETSTYTGGAHGNMEFDALVWDRASGRALSPMVLFTAPAALSDALREPYCAALIEVQRERRGEYFTEPDDPFDRCPTLDELAIVPATSNGVEIDELQLLAAPYVAGAYAEGNYEVTLPVTQAVLDALRPDYREGFAPR
jgi:hypothetical protein